MIKELERMNDYKYDNWKASFKYQLKCCMFGFLYGVIAAIAFIFFFTKYSVIALPICLIAFIAALIWNILSVKFTMKALFIELLIAPGSFFLVMIIWMLADSYMIINIDWE